MQSVLDEVRSLIVPVKPSEDWLTLPQLCELWGATRRAGTLAAESLVASGRLEKRRYRTRVKGGKLMELDCYRLVKGKRAARQ